MAEQPFIHIRITNLDEAVEAINNVLNMLKLLYDSQVIGEAEASELAEKWAAEIAGKYCEVVT